MKNTIGIILLVVVIFVGGTWWSNSLKEKSKNLNVQSASSLLADRIMHDFGEIDIFDGKVTADFTLTNDGDEDITVTDGTTSCGCTNANLEGVTFGMHEKMSRGITVPKGESKVLKVIFDPLAHGPSGVGLAQRSVFLKTNSKETPELEVRVKAMVTKK